MIYDIMVGMITIGAHNKVALFQVRRAISHFLATTHSRSADEKSILRKAKLNRSTKNVDCRATTQLCFLGLFSISWQKGWMPKSLNTGQVDHLQISFYGSQQNLHSGSINPRMKHHKEHLLPTAQERSLAKYTGKLVLHHLINQYLFIDIGR